MTGTRPLCAPALPRVLTSREWRDYYLANARRLRPLPWHLGADISAEELAAIAPSLRAWQLGETSDGGRLIHAAEGYAERFQDPDFVPAVRLFIGEEQRHGETLGRFLDLAGVPRAEANWGDSLFRLARYSLRTMEAWVTPVVMVETHALIYYNSIRQATRSVLLRAICEQILADEVPHIRFQCERLAILHRQRPRWLLAATMAGHRAAFAGVTLAVWLGHRRALRAGGYGFWRFWDASWRKMRHAWRLMSPEAYDWRHGNAALFRRARSVASEPERQRRAALPQSA